MTAAFTGFGEYAVDFYDGLVADNSKAYWDAHRATYDSDVRAPMEALLAALEPEFADGGKPKVFRPYRDVRFAKDKTPYKTHCGGVVEHGRGAGAYYAEVGPDGLRVGGGCFYLQSDQLARFRTAVAEDIHGEQLQKLLTTLEEQGWQLLGDKLKTSPRGVDKDHPRLDLLKHRSIYAVKVWEPDDVLHEPGCLDRVRTAWRQLRPFNEWARDHVGVSEKPRR
ncbi:DUF2461 domain-containing protein [Actinokineospora bangkokensis]|uniref:TIGR02453 family protein n=1 Tax=Actinokineospora bangkokensis TaxID=1193682 RepID=A0A1Q9LQF2_9PSEU|nr:DUF2461 domain-containing protein [Actinokineospora bangkokensis]OLR94259.1 TIGR02453 family protein [Actinokineospora bangkokensis]